MRIRMGKPTENAADILRPMAKEIWHGLGRGAIGIVVALLTSSSLIFAADPVASPPPTVADILKADAEVAAAIEKANKLREAFNAELAKLKIPPVEMVGRPRPGPPGKDGHSPIIAWGTGADFDRLSIDGVFNGPHLTGPKGDPGGGPPPVADPFLKALQDAYAADLGADKSDSLAFLTSCYKLMAVKQKTGLMTVNDGLTWMRSVVEGPGGLTADKLTALRKAIGVELSSTLGTKLTDPLDGVRFAFELNKVATALQGVKP